MQHNLDILFRNNWYLYLAYHIFYIPSKEARIKRGWEILGWRLASCNPCISCSFALYFVCYLGLFWIFHLCSLNLKIPVSISSFRQLNMQFIVFVMISVSLHWIYPVKYIQHCVKKQALHTYNTTHMNGTQEWHMCIDYVYMMYNMLTRYKQVYTTDSKKQRTWKKRITISIYLDTNSPLSSPMENQSQIEDAKYFSKYILRYKAIK